MLRPRPQFDLFASATWQEPPPRTLTACAVAMERYGRINVGAVLPGLADERPIRPSELVEEDGRTYIVVGTHWIGASASYIAATLVELVPAEMLPVHPDEAERHARGASVVGAYWGRDVLLPFGRRMRCGYPVSVTLLPSKP